MNRLKLASELVRIAKELTSKSIISVDFNKTYQMKKYFELHPKANRANHRVVPLHKLSDDEVKSKADMHKLKEKEHLHYSEEDRILPHEAKEHLGLSRIHHNLARECDNESQRRDEVNRNK